MAAYLASGSRSMPTGEIYYSIAFGDSGNPPIPSLADLFYLLYYPPAYAAMVLLVRAADRAFQRQHMAGRRDRGDRPPRP